MYEDAKRHNAVFVGYDSQDHAHYAFMRGTLSERRFMQEVWGGDKRYSFACRPSAETHRRFVFLRARLMRCPMRLFAYIVSWIGRKITCYRWAVCQSIEQATVDKLVVRDLPKVGKDKDYNDMLRAIQSV